MSVCSTTQAGISVKILLLSVY